MGAAMGAGMGANWLSGQLQGFASLIDKWAMGDAYNAELARQAQYQQQAKSAFDVQLPQAGAGGASAQMADAAKTRTADYGQTMAIPLGFDAPNQRSASPGRDVAANQMSAQQRANLQKYGDWQFNQKMNNQQFGRTLDQITNFAGGTARVFPYEMYQAQHAGDLLAEFGASIGALSSGAQGVKSAFGNGPPNQPPPRWDGGGGGSGVGGYYNFGEFSPAMVDYLDTSSQFYTNPNWSNPNYGGSFTTG